MRAILEDVRLIQSQTAGLHVEGALRQKEPPTLRQRASVHVVFLRVVPLPLPNASVKTGMSEMAEAAVRRHRAQVFRYLRRRTGSDELADDLTQDVFLTAAARLARLELGETPLAWLYTVAKSRLLDEARRARRRPQVVPLELATTVADLDYPQELASALRSAALRLPPSDRELIGRRLFGERSFAQHPSSTTSTTLRMTCP